MSIENLDIVTSIQNYIAELERTANVSGGEAAEYAAEASRSGLESLPGERREKLISYCLLIAAKRVRAVTGGSAVRSDMEPCDWVNEFYFCLGRVLRRFDPDRASLPTYISAAFDSFMKSYSADCDIRGRHYVASVNQLRRKREQLFRLNSCEPSDELLMKELGWGQLRLRNVRMAESGSAVIRLNDPAGDVNKVVPVDKSSTVLTMALAFIFLNESISPLKCICMVMILAGTLLMIENNKTYSPGSNSAKWLPYAILSAIFAALTSILGKIGIDGVSSDLGTAIRTAVVLVMAWLMIPVTGKADKLRGLDKRELLFIALSGLATGGSWLCYYKALQDGPASVVVPIDKLSILVSILFSYIVFHEKLTKRSAAGLAILVAGTLLMLVG